MKKGDSGWDPKATYLCTWQLPANRGTKEDSKVGMGKGQSGEYDEGDIQQGKGDGAWEAAILGKPWRIMLLILQKQYAYENHSISVTGLSD